MRGNACFPSTWRWSRRWRRAGLARSLALVAVAVLPRLGAQPASAVPAVPPVAHGDVLGQVRELLATPYPDLDAGALLDYYSRTSPDIHAEIRSRIESRAEDTAAYLSRLADHFQRLERVRQRSPTEFERLQNLDLLESRARMLGRLILQSNAALTDGSAEDASAVRASMNRAKEELRSVLERAFDGTQQNQRIELNRLEAELRTMRRLLDERAAKRDLIIRQRFIELCGQELPPPSASPVVTSGTPGP